MRSLRRAPSAWIVCVGVAASCGGPQIQERRAADLTKHAPATLEVSQPREGDPRTVKIRVWVDAGVRATPTWKDELADQLDHAGQVLTPLLGIKLEVEAWKEWNRTGDPSEALRQLADADPGKAAIWVIGFITPADRATKAMSELGDAAPLGRHVIVRGWATQPETDALSPSLPDLKLAERAEVLAGHQRHKQTVVLLHMLARTLGAIGESDTAWIQHPVYSPKQAGFSDRTRELLQLAIDGRLADDEDKRIAHGLVERIEREEWGGWIASDRAQLLVMLRAIVTAGKAGQAAPDVPVAALESIERIRAAAKRGDLASALTELDNILAAYPGNASMYQLKCELLLVKPGVGDPTARQTGARVAELAPGDPRPHLAVGEALARAGDPLGARAELVRASDKIAKLQAGTDDAWQRLIAIYQAMGALSWTEEAPALAKLERTPTAAEIASKRARYGVPRGTKLVRPEHEAALVAAVRAALDLVYANKYPEAAKAIAAGEKRWPGAPGFAAARCDLELRQAHLEPARAACNKAIAVAPDQSWALYLSGVIALKDTTSGTLKGIEQLKKAIAADPDLGQAWRTLAKAYKRARDDAALDQLAKDYAQKFGTPLPR